MPIRARDDDNCRSLGLKGVLALITIGPWSSSALLSEQKKVSYFRTIFLEYIYLFYFLFIWLFCIFYRLFEYSCCAGLATGRIKRILVYDRLLYFFSLPVLFPSSIKYFKKTSPFSFFGCLTFFYFFYKWWCIL